MILGEKELARMPAHLQALFYRLPNPGSEEVVGAFPDAPGQQGALTGHEPSPTFSGENIYGAMARTQASTPRGDSGSAARFFYTAKADSDDRLGSKHPTVKPLDLMQWLIRLVCPRNGLLIDPFAGTGTTGEAAFREGCRAVLIEREAEYQADTRKRMELVLAGPDERAGKSAKQEPIESLPLFKASQPASQPNMREGRAKASFTSPTP